MTATIHKKDGTTVQTSSNPTGGYNYTTTDKSGSVSKTSGGSYKSATTGDTTSIPVTGTAITSSGASSNPISTPVITSSSAQADLAKKQGDFATLSANNAAQALKIKQQQLIDQQNADLKNQQDLENKNSDTLAKQKQQEIDAKSAALGVNASVPTPPQGMSSQDYANFKKANPTLEPTAEDVRRNNEAGTPAGYNNELSDVTSSFNNSIAGIQDQKDLLATKTSKQLNSILNGTFPLTGPQQSIITSLQNQLAQNVSDQKLANASYEGSVAQAGFRAGGEYTPEQYAGQIHNAVSTGVAKIQALDNDAALTMANLENDFQKEDYTMITQNYDLLNKQLQDKSDAIKDTFSATSSLLKDQRDFQIQTEQTAYDRKQDQFNNNLALAKFGEDKRQFDILHPQTDETVSSAQFTKDKIDNIDTILNDRAIAAAVGSTPLARSKLSPYSLTGERQNFIAGVSQLTSQLTLDNLIQAKAKGATFGALSEGELGILANGASKIDKWAIKDDKGNVKGYNVSEKDFKKELDKINNFAKRDYLLKGGSPADVGATINSAGKVVVKNSDGSITEL